MNDDAPRRPTPTAHTAEIGEITMRWDHQPGTGVPVVLVHGIPTSPALWRRVLPHLAGLDVYAWEMVGYGSSIPEGRGRPIGVAHQAEYLRAWARHLKIGSAVLVGHDLGGGVVQIAAVEEPSLAAGLVLTNAIGYDSWPIPSVKAMAALGGVLRWVPWGLLRPGLLSLFLRGHDDLEVARTSFAVHTSYYGAADGSAALVRQMRALDVRDTLAVQHRLPTLADRPARIVWGAADQFQTLDYGHRFARDLDAELVEIPGGKHFVPEDHPEELAAAIRQVAAEAGTS